MGHIPNAVHDVAQGLLLVDDLSTGELKLRVAQNDSADVHDRFRMFEASLQSLTRAACFEARASCEYTS